MEDTFKIKRVGNTHARIVTDMETGTRVLLSYDTPVAFVKDGVLYETTTKWSVTTKRHLSKWRSELEYPETDHVGQSVVDAALFCIVGDVRYAETRPTTMGYKANTRGVKDDDYTEPGNMNLYIPVYRR